MPKLNVILRKEDLDPAFLHDKVAVVIDVLFATSTIVCALHHGALEVQPMRNHQQASEAIRELADGSYLLAGENHLRPIRGFAGYSPLDLARQPVQGRRLVFCTTNGTVALHLASCARHVYAAALLNGPAVVRQLLQHPDLSIMLVCAGSAGRVNQEDLFAAGYLVEHLEQASPGTWQTTDTCNVARALYRQYADTPAACLLEGRLGRQLATGSMREEVLYAAQIGLLDVVPRLSGQCLTALNA
jgi:2-phosphosulfolactate phosphatase